MRPQPTPLDPDVLLDQGQVAKRIHMSPKFLEARRVRGGGPSFIRVGRYVRYRLADVNSWLESRRMSSTSSR